jgi:GTP-binding protein Era
MQQEHTHKSGYVAVAGRPNVGKSTLTNAILKFPLSIIAAKPQTTRHRILGIHSETNAQIIFLDTPGLIDPNYKLQEWMMKAAKSALNDADIILFLVEASIKPKSKDIKILQIISESERQIVLVINKIDTIEKAEILPLIDAYRQLYNFIDIVPISALTGENIDDLKKTIIDNLPSGPPFFPVDMITERPERFFVSELIREQIFENFGDELPFSTAVIVEEFHEHEGRKDYIRARIVVERESQKKIVIGKGGQAIRDLGQKSRRKVEDFLGRPIYLELFVAVREKWRKKDVFLKEFGYDFRSI